MGAAIKTTRRGLFGHAAGVCLAAGALTTGIGAVSLASLWERRARLLAEEARLDAEYRAAEARYEACKPPLPPEAIVPAQLAKGQGWMTAFDADGNRILIGYERQWRRWSRLLIGGYWPAECARRADVMLEYESATDALRKQIVAEHSRAANRNSGELWELEEHMLAVPAAVRTSLKTITADIAQSLEASLAAAPFEAAFAGYEEFEGAIKALSAASAAGQPGILAFRQAVEDIADARPSDKFLQELAGKFLELTKKAGETELALEGSNRAIAETARVASGAIAAVQGYRDALSDLAGIALPTLSPMQMADEAYGRALEGATSPGARAAADAEYLEAVTRIKEREAEKQAEIDKRQGEQNAERMVRESQQQQDALSRRVEGHQWALMTEMEQEQASFATRMEELAAFYEGKAELEAEYRDLKERAEEDHAARVTDIMDRQAQRELAVKQQEFRVMGDMFGNLATVANAFGEKGFLAAKAFSIGQAVMNTSEAITAALASAPPPLNFAAAAAVAAAGAVQIAAIASARPGNARAPAVSGRRKLRRFRWRRRRHLVRQREQRQRPRQHPLRHDQWRGPRVARSPP